MNAYIYCFDKGLFIKKKFPKLLKKELESEFGNLDMDKYVHLNMLLCKVESSSNSYFSVYEYSVDLDRLINVLKKVSNIYKLHLSCTLSKDSEKDLLDYIRKQTDNDNITVRATMDL